MKVLTEIPDDIVEMITDNEEQMSRGFLSEKAGISEHLARYYLKLYKNIIADNSHKSIGMQQILQDRVSTQAKIIQKLQKELATEEILIEKMKEIVPYFNVPKELKYNFKDTYDKKEREAITIWSDFHAGEIVDAAQMENRNEYNAEIMAGRLWDLVQAIIKIVDNYRAGYTIRTLNIDILGDIVSGNIHEELRETNELPILQTSFLTAFLIAQAISILVNHFEKIRVICIPGNHGRLSVKPQFKNKVINNYDTLVYQQISLHLSEFIKKGIIEFNIPDSSECIAIRKGWAFLLGHSDQVKAWSGFPVYGFYRDSAKQQKLRKLRSVLSKNEIMQSDDLEGAVISMENTRAVSGYDYREAGHWHAMQVIDDWTTIINGALIGGNEYSINKLHVISPPTQTLAFISETWGLKSIEPIHCHYSDHRFYLFRKGVIGNITDIINKSID